MIYQIVYSSFGQKLGEYITKDLPKYLGETLEMVFLSALIATLFGLILGTILFLLRKGKGKKAHIAYKILDIIVGIFRSFPFYVLMFFIIPFTRVVMKIFTGRAISMSTEAFIIPLSVAAIPFFGKLIENAIMEIDEGVLEASKSLGLSLPQIIFRVILREALPSIISGITLAIITLVGYSAMAGAVGGGGLGFYAYSVGYTSYDFAKMMFAVITIILIVSCVQVIGNLLYKKFK